MSSVVLTEAFLDKTAGWQAVKIARGLLESGQVLNSSWNPPLLKGVVVSGGVSYSAGLVIKDSFDIENLCTCRDSKRWGTICAHSVAVGLQVLLREKIRNSPPEPGLATPPPRVITETPKPNPAPTRQLRRAAPGQRNEELQLFFILPPALSQAVSRGKIMVCLEGQAGSRRGPISNFISGSVWRLAPEDESALSFLEQLSGGETPSLIQLSPSQFAQWISRVRGHPRLTLGKSGALTVSEKPVELILQARLEPSGDISVQSFPPREGLLLSCGGEAWMLRETTLFHLEMPATLGDSLNRRIQVPREEVPELLSQHWPLLQKTCRIEADFKPEDFDWQPLAPKFGLRLAGGLARLQARLETLYEDISCPAYGTGGRPKPWIPDPSNPKRYLARDLLAEQGAVTRLLKAGFHGPDATGQYLLEGQDSVTSFFVRLYPRWKQEWDISFEDRLQGSVARNFESVEVEFKVIPSGERWFDLDVSYKSQSGEVLSSSDLQRLLMSSRGGVRLKSGRLAMLDVDSLQEFQETIQDCAPQQHAGGFRFNQAQAGFLAETLRQQKDWKVQAPAEWHRQVALQCHQNQIEIPSLGAMDAILRPYQKTGVAWLLFLRRNGFGGILADEMGLGKTLQTLGFLEAMRLQAGAENRPPSLVVCPASLVHNWLNEARRFAPNLRVLVLHGPQRHSLWSEVPDHHLVITTYALVRRDAEQYRNLALDTVILDEAQHIKNRQTQNAQAVKAIRSQGRLVLTGTPMENSVLDLWSIFDFLMPGYLGSGRDFHERYELPIMRDRDASVQTRLRRRLRPFVLRRVKRDVAPELPERIDQVSYCELTETQKVIYQQILDAARQEVLQAAGSPGGQPNRMRVFAALLRLRQICCDPRLLELEGDEAKASSAKFELFQELVEEVVDGGHRVLVFSQFVRMLKLLQAHLESEGIDYCYLDGSTTDRGRVVQRFQENNHIPVFLISLKAGGVGLNLAAADTVIHYDPWWNPAVEQQATDRAHRIGQTRIVTSYKLITRGTVEEKILNLQERKRELIAGMLGSEDAFINSLTWDEIQELLAT